jgi:hypothetical protein
MCEARDPAAVVERFKPEEPGGAFVDVSYIFDTNVLVNERRLVLLPHAPVKDLSEQAASAEAEEGDNGA